MPGSPPPSGPSPEPTPALEAAAAEVSRLAGGRFDVLGPLGQDGQGAYAFLARPADGGEDLVVLKAVADDPFMPAKLEVIPQLDGSVPPPAGSCPVCQAPFRGWDPSCPDCGADLAGAAVQSETARERLRSAVRGAAQGYDVLGDMRRATGGGIVFFARELSGGQIVALRLDQEEISGERQRFTVAATRMMRPHLLYGAVGGRPADETRAEPGRAGSWAPKPAASVSSAGGDFGARICPQCGDSFEGDLRFCPKDGSALRVGSAEGLIGHVIAERYRIMEKLGEGGMGRVYLAEHIHMGRRCAVKVMNPALLQDADSLSRFAREAANASRITHPNVAAIYDFGETADRIVYLAMELVEGGSLAQILERERGLPASRAVAIGQQVADALTAAYEFGIVHRDLKPDNIMLARARTGQDVVKVVDFGIAKARTGGKQTVTRTGFVVGTPAYMSPEQILGDELDGRSDIYSLGCILFEMLTGERAFAGPSGEVVIRKRLTENPPPPSRIRRELGKNIDAIVLKAMARSPDHRFGSAAELRDALQAAAAESASQPWWRSLVPARTGPGATSDPKLVAGAPPGASAGTVPVPVGWAGAGPPVEPERTRATVLRHRSARPDSSFRIWMATGSVVAAAAILFGWRVLGSGTSSPDSEPATAPADVSPSPTSPPATPAGPTEGRDATAGERVPPPPPDTAAGITPAPPTAPTPADSGVVHFAFPLPPDARVTVDGKRRPLAPDGSLKVGPGTHTITVRAPGYRTASERAAVAPGELRELAITLAPETGTGQPERPPATGQPEPPSATGQPGPPPATGQPGPPPAATAKIVIAGDVPPDAELRVDGQVQPSGSRVVTVPSGSHRVVISAPGYASDSTEIQVGPGARVEWIVPPRVSLEVPAPASRAPPPVAVETAPAAGAGKPPSPAPKPAAGVEAEAGARGAVNAYAQAINARNIAQLRKVFPTMPAERERQWRDLFRGEVKDLTASVSAVRVAAGATPGVEFELMLSFRPDREKSQSFRISNQATVRQEGSGWYFISLIERGQ